MARKNNTDKKAKVNSAKKKTKSVKASKKVKKDQIQGPKFSVKEFVILLAVFSVIGAAIWTFNSVRNYFLRTDLFTVKKISTNVAINYKLKPQNIFKIDLKDIESDIRYAHPEFKAVRVDRAFPDVLDVQVLERVPYFQIEKKGYYLVDVEGVISAGPSDVPYDQILVYPNWLKRGRLSLGKKLELKYFDQMIELISYLKKYNASKIYTIKELRAESINQMNFLLDTIEVRIGDGNYSHKIDILFERILPQYNHDFEKIEYIDLRFNDYVIGYKK